MYFCREFSGLLYVVKVKIIKTKIENIYKKGGLRMDLPLREILFWGGIAGMGASAVMFLFSVVLAAVTGKHLKRKLEEEYGKL